MTAPRSITNRALTTNEPWRLPGVDGRTPTARRFHDLCVSFAADLGAELTEGDRVLVRNAAMAALSAENLQAKLISGEVVDSDAVVRLAGVSARALEELRRRRAAQPKPDGRDAHDAGIAAIVARRSEAA